jgi:GNAT superfamily N-acetyltransferase
MAPGNEHVNFVIARQAELPPDVLAVMVAESERDGCRFVRRLADEWAAGINRFDRDGEGFFTAHQGGAVVGVCGLNVDPYTDEPRIGRVRRLYVLRAYRRHEVGRKLVEAVVRAASGHFRSLRLRTKSPEAAAFYERLGFEPVVGIPNCTHVLELAADA